MGAARGCAKGFERELRAEAPTHGQGIDSSVKVVLEELERMAKPIAKPEEIKQVATISADFGRVRAVSAHQGKGGGGGREGEGRARNAP